MRRTIEIAKRPNESTNMLASRVPLFFYDFFICALSFYLSKFLFDIASSWIGKLSLSFEVLQYFKRNAFLFLGLYALFNALAFRFKNPSNRPRPLGAFGLALTSGFYAGGVSLWMEMHGFPLKVFFLFFFFVLWGTAFMGRHWFLKMLLILTRRLPWLNILSPVFVRGAARIHAYIKGKPSAPFIIAFMIVLVCCAVLLSVRKEEVAERLAGWAYFALVIGVVLELVQITFKKDKDGSGGL